MSKHSSDPASPQHRHGPWRVLRASLRPAASRAQLLAGLLCALLGFALVVQVRQTQTENLSTLRQSDLVRIMDEVTQRQGDLEQERAALQESRERLESGSETQQAALELAVQRAKTQGILSGRLPAEGPGVRVTLTEGTGRLPASSLVNVLEELRNAGAEAIQLNGIRLVASSYVIDSGRGIVVDGVTVSAPYVWVAIGDPATLSPALEIPGGAMAVIRTASGRGEIEELELAEVTATREPTPPRFATPMPPERAS